MFGKIVIATDLSELSEKLLDFVDSFVEQGTEEVHLIHAIDSRYPGGAAASEDVEADARELQKKCSKLEDEYDIKTTVSIETGYPPEEIIEKAGKLKADLIVAGSRGHNWLSEYLLGSTAADLLRISKKPILLGRFRKQEQGEDSMPVLKKCSLWKKIVVATDLSDAAKNAEKAALELSAFAGAVKFVTVHTNKMAKNFSKEVIEEHLENLVEKASENSEASWDLVEGIAYEELEKIADASSSCLIITGKRGGGAVRKLLLGSTPSALSRHSKHHILVMP